MAASARKVHLLTVPYDSGVRNVRMGSGPIVLAADLERHFAATSHQTSAQEVAAPVASVPAEITTAFALSSELADDVRQARAAGSLPVILSGSCYAALGVVAGLAPHRPGVVWFDSHADFNTPDTTQSGFLDGMALAMLTGRCWRQLIRGIDGFEPVRDETVLLVGARDVDDLERLALAKSGTRLIPPEQVASALPDALARLRTRVRELYLHIDLDVLDPSYVRANALAAPGGLRARELTSAVTVIRKSIPVTAVALTAYDPTFDPDGKIGRACRDVLDAVLGCTSSED